MAPRRASRVLRSLNAALTPPAALVPSPASADETPNTALAARWAPCAPPPHPCPPGLSLLHGGAEGRGAARTDKIDKLLYSTTVSPNWIEGGELFWYAWRSSSGTDYLLVDCAAGTQTPIFDNDMLARSPEPAAHCPAAT